MEVSGAGGGNLSNLVNGSNKGGSTELVHAVQPWIVDANAVWSGNRVRRYNRGIVRWPANWKGPAIQFDAVNTPLVFSDGLFAIVVDGVIQASVGPTSSTSPSNFYVPITTLPGGSTVEVWEPWNGKPGSQNTGADGPVEGGIVTAVYLPQGVSLTKPSCTTGIVCVGDSISGAYVTKSAGFPQGYYGPGGQLRLLAQAKGWLLTSLDYGGATLLSDGLTAANYITWIQEAITAMGSPSTVKVLYLPCRNDYADNGTGSSTTPSQATTFLQAIVNGLTTGFQHIICTPVPQADESAVNTFTLPDWRTAIAAVTGVTALDGTSFGIGTDATWLPDGVHLSRTLGVPAYVAGVKGALGL